MSYRDVWKTLALAWRLYQQYAGWKLRDGDWEQLTATAGKLYHESGKKEFVREVLAAVMAELQRQDKGKGTGR